MHEFADEMAVLGAWLGRDLTADHAGALPPWSVFRFRDAVVFQPDEPGHMYLVRGDAVRELLLSRETIDAAYAELGNGPLPAAA